MNRARGRGRAIGVAAVVGALVAGCGSQSFSAEEVVAEINDRGGALELGEPLGESEGGIELHSLAFSSTASVSQDVHAGGSLLIAGDDDAALAEFRRCEAAASLVCFRAANAVLMFEDTVPNADLTRLGGAIQALASD